MDLLTFRYDKYSSTGNDGIIEYIFDVLRVKKGFFVEFGSRDGISGSNCRKLFEEGWTGIFIESDLKQFNNLICNYKNTVITCINAKVDSKDNSFDKIVTQYTSHIDFCSIDIDGLDIEVFETFEKCMPDVICIEGGQMLHPDHILVSRNKAKNNIQQSLGIMTKIFALKGYRVICSYQDTFFVKNKFYKSFDVSEDIMDLYLDGLKAHARRIPWIKKILKNNGLNNPIINKILKHTNFDKYGWHKRKEWAVNEKVLINKIIEDIRISD